VKFLNPEHLDTATVRERLEREACILRGLKHRGIVQVLDDASHPCTVVTDDDHERSVVAPFFVMEFIEGFSLEDQLQVARCNPHMAVAVLEQMAEALGAIHSKQIVHRDFKPANILLDGRTSPLVVKLVDFGIAKSERSPITRLGCWAGSNFYASPEQFRELSSTTDRSDVYSFAAVAYELLNSKGTVADGDISQTDLQQLNFLELPVRTVLQEGLTDEMNNRPAIGTFWTALKASLASSFAPTKLETTILASSLAPTKLETTPINVRVAVTPGSRGWDIR